MNLIANSYRHAPIWGEYEYRNRTPLSYLEDTMSIRPEGTICPSRKAVISALQDSKQYLELVNSGERETVKLGNL